MTSLQNLKQEKLKTKKENQSAKESLKQLEQQLSYLKQEKDRLKTQVAQTTRQLAKFEKEINAINLSKPVDKSDENNSATKASDKKQKGLSVG
jgi:septal ring factor EnvC (AmiA/AmiB activator)